MNLYERLKDDPAVIKLLKEMHMTDPKRKEQEPIERKELPEEE